MIRFSFISIGFSTKEYSGVFFDCVFMVLCLCILYCVCSLGQSSYYFDIRQTNTEENEAETTTKPRQRADENSKKCRSQMIRAKRCDNEVRSIRQKKIVWFSCSELVTLQPWHYLWLNFANLLFRHDSDESANSGGCFIYLGIFSYLDESKNENHSLRIQSEEIENIFFSSS